MERNGLVTFTLHHGTVLNGRNGCFWVVETGFKIVLSRIFSASVMCDCSSWNSRSSPANHHILLYMSNV